MNPSAISPSLFEAINRTLEENDFSGLESDEEIQMAAAQHVRDHHPEVFDFENPVDMLVLTMLDLK